MIKPPDIENETTPIDIKLNTYATGEFTVLKWY